MKSVKGFWQDITTGAVYAIESTPFGRILGGVGPLRPDNLKKPEDYHYKQAINEWLKEAVAEQRLRPYKPQPADAQT